MGAETWPNIHTFIHAYIHTHIHTYVHTCIHTYIQLYNSAKIHSCICASCIGAASCSNLCWSMLISSPPDLLQLPWWCFPSINKCKYSTCTIVVTHCNLHWWSCSYSSTDTYAVCTLLHNGNLHYVVVVVHGKDKDIKVTH